MSGMAMDQKLVTQLEAIAESEGCELAHVSFKGGQLRLILDHPEAVTLEHCTKVSRHTSALLDVEDFGKGRYTLEVSSPGLDRELYRAKDYERFLGSLARVRFRDPEDFARKTVIGRMERFENEVLTLVEAQDTEGKAGASRPTHHQIPLSAIELARLEIEI